MFRKEYHQIHKVSTKLNVCILEQIVTSVQNVLIQKNWKISKNSTGGKMENYSQILKSWGPPHNMHTFFLSNYQFKFLTRSSTQMCDFCSIHENKAIHITQSTANFYSVSIFSKVYMYTPDLVVPDLDESVVCAGDQVWLISPWIVVYTVNSLLVALQGEVRCRRS